MKASFAPCVVAACLLAVVLPTGEAFADPVALKGDEIAAKLKGNSLSGKTDGKAWTEYFLSDGEVRGVWGGDRYKGTWTIKGDQLCETYPDASYNFCNAVTLDGNTIHYVKPDGSDNGGAELASGNPKNL